MLRSTAGSRLFIGPRLDTAAELLRLAPAAAAAGISWTEVRRLQGLGELRVEWETETLRWFGGPKMGERRKMLRSGGGMTIVMGLDDDDGGQLALLAAEAQEADFPFLLRFGDAPGDPFRIWGAIVVGLTEGFGEADNVMTRAVDLLVNTPIGGAEETWRE